MSAGKRGFWIGFVVVALIVAFIAASLLRSGGNKGVEVRYEPLQRASIESWVRAPGRIEPVRTVQISSNIQGRVEVLSVEEGDRVVAGDLLLQLDDERYRSQVTQVRSRLEAAVANRRVAEAQAARARQDLERKERLFQQKLIAPEALEDAATNSRVETARAEAAREDAESTRAQLDQAEKDLAETVFRAPISGIVTSLNVEEGENVVTGTMNTPGTVLLTLAELDTMQAQVDVDETDVVRIDVGQQAKVFVDALPNTELDGRVTTVGQSGRAQSSREGTNFRVEVLVFDPPPTLRPGMSADVEILTGSAQNVWVVPIQALSAFPRSLIDEWREDDPSAAEGEGKGRVSSGNDDLVEGVFVDDGGTARFHSVTLGLRSETEIELSTIVPPLDAEAKVLVGPYRALRNLEHGDAVQSEEERAAGRSR